MSSAPTTAMAIRAHGGTVSSKTTEGKLRLTLVLSHKAKLTPCQTDSILNLSRKWACSVPLLTWDFINFIQEFALDLLKHVILVDLRVVGARGFGHGGGNDTRGGSRGHGGGTASGLSGRHGLWPPEEVELHCQRLDTVSLKHTQKRKKERIGHTK